MIDSIAQVAKKRLGQGAKPDKSFPSGKSRRRILILRRGLDELLAGRHYVAAESERAAR